MQDDAHPDVICKRDRFKPFSMTNHRGMMNYDASTKWTIMPPLKSMRARNMKTCL